MALHTLVLTLHVLGACIVFAVVFFSVVVTIKSTWSPQILDRLHFIGRFGMFASLWQLLTGIYLMSSEWSELRENHLLWTKLILYVIEGTLAGMLIERKAKTATQERKPSGLGTLMLVHAVLILAIITIGVMIVEQ